MTTTRQRVRCLSSSRRFIQEPFGSLRTAWKLSFRDAGLLIRTGARPPNKRTREAAAEKYTQRRLLLFAYFRNKSNNHEFSPRTFCQLCLFYYFQRREGMKQSRIEDVQGKGTVVVHQLSSRIM